MIQRGFLRAPEESIFWEALSILEEVSKLGFICCIDLEELFLGSALASRLNLGLFPI